ncbi:putative Nucleosome assembly protein (NAP) [Blattamonas nauphoetae]|uniref:Nucleosome assembly protein (NAP) n=1 Tax=Blattamonas nauphoetae TaxID=2049346 RepID=A0ABQ9Y477_9EUKA|nr:putative Nucleosome assembly protein (NAP) [Blattamonas nauphoetae]
MSGPSTETLSEEDFTELHDIQSQINDIVNQIEETVTKIDLNLVNQTMSIYKDRDAILRQIPHFWLMVFQSHPIVRSFLEDPDTKAVFKHCTSLFVEDDPNDITAFTIKLEFSENPYFENKILEKRFQIHEDDYEPRIQQSTIKWKPDKNFIESNKSNLPVDTPPSFSFLELFNEDETDTQFAEILRTIFDDPMAVLDNADDEAPNYDDSDFENSQPPIIQTLIQIVTILFQIVSFFVSILPSVFAGSGFVLLSFWIFFHKRQEYLTTKQTVEYNVSTKGDVSFILILGGVWMSFSIVLFGFTFYRMYQALLSHSLEEFHLNAYFFFIGCIFEVIVLSIKNRQQFSTYKKIIHSTPLVIEADKLPLISPPNAKASNPNHRVTIPTPPPQARFVFPSTVPWSHFLFSELSFISNVINAVTLRWADPPPYTPGRSSCAKDGVWLSSNIVFGMGVAGLHLILRRHAVTHSMRQDPDYIAAWTQYKRAEQLARQKIHRRNTVPRSQLSDYDELMKVKLPTPPPNPHRYIRFWDGVFLITLGVLNPVAKMFLGINSAMQLLKSAFCGLFLFYLVAQFEWIIESIKEVREEKKSKTS